MLQHLAPIILFLYNRPDCTMRTLDALAASELAKESELFIYCDGPKTGANEAMYTRIKETRHIAQNASGFKKIHCIMQEYNKGLAASVIDAVTNIIRQYGTVIVLEDDIIVSRGFLSYMNRALEKYRNTTNVMQISGFNFPLYGNHKWNKHDSYFLRLSSTWGWGTWKDKWAKLEHNAEGYELLKTDANLAKSFDFNGCYPYTQHLLAQMEYGIDSWGIKWWWTVFRSNGLVLFPSKSLVQNIGFGKDATHTNASDPFYDKYFDSKAEVTSFPDRIEENARARKATEKYIKRALGSEVSLRHKIRHLIGKFISYRKERTS